MNLDEKNLLVMRFLGQRKAKKMLTQKTPKQRLIERIEREFDCTITFLKYTAGYWRRADVFRWEANAVKDGMERTLQSWFTVTECVRAKRLLYEEAEDRSEAIDLEVIAFRY